MKIGRKPTVSSEDIRRLLIPYIDDIMPNNILINPTNNIWIKLIGKYEWNISPKALWTRIHKYAPNFNEFFFFEYKKKIFDAKTYRL